MNTASSFAHVRRGLRALLGVVLPCAIFPVAADPFSFSTGDQDVTPLRQGRPDRQC